MEVEDLIRMAKDTMKRQGEHTPLFFMELPDGIEVLGVPFTNDNDRDYAVSALKRLVEENDCRRYFSVLTGWMVEGEGQDNIEPSQHPERFEVLMVSEYTKRGTATVTFKVKRQDDKVIDFEQFHEKLQKDASITETYCRFNVWAPVEIHVEDKDATDTG